MTRLGGGLGRRSDTAGDAVVQTLLAAVRGESAARPGWLRDAPGQRLFDSAVVHGVDHRVLDWLRAVDPDHAAVPKLAERARVAVASHLRSLAALRQAADALRAAGVPFLVMKGPVLVRLGDEGRAVRPYGDIDLLVTGDRIGAAVDALVGAGATLFPWAGWKSLLEQEHAEVPLTLPLGVSADLHWHLGSRPKLRQRYAVADAGTLIGRATSLDLGAGPVPVLEGADMLLHTAAHAGWSGGDRLGWLVDVDAVARRAPVVWDEVAARAHEWHVEVLVADALRRAHELVGTPVPDGVLADLERSWSARLVRAAASVTPVRPEISERALGRVVRLDAESELVPTLRRLAVRFGGAVTRRVRGGSTENDEPPLEPAGADDAAFRAGYEAFARASAPERS